MAHLDFVFNGQPIRSTDMSAFRTENALAKWRRDVVKAWASENDDSHRLRFSEALDEIVQPVRDKLRFAAEARKKTAPLRHQSLVVVPPADSDREITYDTGPLTAQNIFYQHFQMFKQPEQMTFYEFDAYDMLGEDECDRLGIETLYDMFGAEWGAAFFRHKNLLILRQRIADLTKERNAIDDFITDCLKEIKKLG